MLPGVLRSFSTTSRRLRNSSRPGFSFQPERTESSNLVSGVNFPVATPFASGPRTTTPIFDSWQYGNSSFSAPRFRKLYSNCTAEHFPSRLNAFTTLALFAGFYAIVQGMNHQFEQAAIAIFVAMVFDGLDGRVARLTRTQSAFGAEYDRLADMVSFGVAPALVVYVWALKDFADMQTVAWLGPWLTTKLGWIAAFIYCACAALRLARFNTTLDIADKRFFQGLPSPAAACVVAGLVWALNEYHVQGRDVKWLAYGPETQRDSGRTFRLPGGRSRTTG